MTKRNMVTRLVMKVAVLCATLAALSTVAVGTASAMLQASPPGYPCGWQNTRADPTLWVREFPSTSAHVLYGISILGHVYGTPYEAYNDAFHWVELSSGGWANAYYLSYYSPGSEYGEVFCV